MRCNECQAEVPDHASRCRGCGTARGAPGSPRVPAPTPAAPARSELPEVRADGTLRCLCCGRTTSVTSAGRCVLCGEPTARVVQTQGSSFVSRLNAPLFGSGTTGHVLSSALVVLLAVVGIAGKVARLTRSSDRSRHEEPRYRPTYTQPTYTQPTYTGGYDSYDSGGYGGYDSGGYGGYDAGGDW